jgi:hypothetical protein
MRRRDDRVGFSLSIAIVILQPNSERVRLTSDASTIAAPDMTCFKDDKSNFFRSG